ncbi:hypothetical protein QVD17_37486 [Tagetes erecta]|uniref:Uncharacterized protein n=1 Tax=Tagetes erecta TaxID=13708 RepID=A0AAD8NK23_TARER|nr:hypothetical protein QVD17_37486 [Tagetes erecta]
MATRQAFRYVSRRFSSSGKILSEEEKAAENIYIKKVEQEKLEKLARQGQKAAEASSASSGGSGSVPGTASRSTASSSSTGGVSTDKYKNYAIVAGALTGLGALGWYLKSKDKKTEDLHN